MATSVGPLRGLLGWEFAALLAALVLLVAVAMLLRRRRAVRVLPSATPPSSRAAGPEATPHPPAPSAYQRMRSGLARTRAGLVGRLGPLLGRRGRLDPEAMEELEAALLSADVGVGMTGQLLRRLQERREDSDESVREVLQREIASILGARPQPHRDWQVGAPHVIMVVGVNGVGKTTSIGKLAARYVSQGKRTLLVAGDTFRAAAIEQLEVWAGRAGADIVRQQQGGDPGAVVYDGMRAAVGRRADVVIVDTAGRLHTKTNLMEELRKVRRIIAREIAGAPHETLLVLDAVTGQNGLAQARAFLEHLEVTGVILTKLDGTAKGGIVVAIAGELGVPVRHLGIGERVEDLRDFDPESFAAALIGPADETSSLDSEGASPVT